MMHRYTNLGGPMRTRTIMAALAALLIAAGATWWLTRPSYEDVVKSCAHALDEQYKHNGRGRPTACDAVKDDDYSALVLQASLNQLGWTDRDGNFDENKMIESVLNDQP